MTTLLKKLAESILERQKEVPSEYRFFTAGDLRSSRAITETIRNKRAKNEKTKRNWN
jgi:hypothetical protein